MRIGELNYSGKATKLIAALMVCVLVFTLAIPAQPAEAVAGTTVAVAAGLTLAFVAACGLAFTVNESQNSSAYWEGQIEDYMSENSYSSVDEWADFSQVTYNSGILGFPGVIVDALLSFFNWFTGKNGITAGGIATISSSNEYLVTSDGISILLGTATGTGTLASGDYEPGQILYTSSGVSEVTYSFDATTCYFAFNGSAYTDSVLWYSCYDYANYNQQFDRSTYHSFSCVKLSNGYVCLLAQNVDGTAYCRRLHNYFSFNSFVEIKENSYVATASDVVGLPDLEEKEAELGYVPDVNIPLPESVAADTNIGDINDASAAVLDYAGTAGNTLDLEYEYVEDTNVDTGTDTETGEGTQEGTGTDAETGTQTGSVALENVAADSLVEVAPETMLEDDTLLGLFISKFPWCIPFDLYYAISAFAADPVAPEFEVNLFEGVSWEGLDLSGTEMTLSFEAFEKVAAVTRWSTLIVFCAGLAMITKRMIWS